MAGGELQLIGRFARPFAVTLGHRRVRTERRAVLALFKNTRAGDPSSSQATGYDIAPALHLPPLRGEPRTLLLFLAPRGSPLVSGATLPENVLSRTSRPSTADFYNRSPVSPPEGICVRRARLRCTCECVKMCELLGVRARVFLCFAPCSGLDR